MHRHRLIPLLLAFVVPLLAFSVVSADGEAGLVVDYGDGDVRTFCVGFSGDDIRGDQLLRAAGVSLHSISGLVCALDGTGCPDASNTQNCLCKCQGSNCTYWSYFTQKYGASWIYSSLGLTAQKSRDGDLQAWKWGTGGPSSAPAPAATTFEQVCGHAPRGGAVQQPPAPAATTGSAAQPAQPATPAPTAPALAQQTPQQATPTPVPQAQTPVVQPTVFVPPVNGVESEPADEGVPTAVFVFAVIAMSLVLIIAGIVFKRRGLGL
jgi:hypothetical protein